jgi:hypothetical protein
VTIATLGRTTAKGCLDVAVIRPAALRLVLGASADVAVSRIAADLVFGVEVELTAGSTAATLTGAKAVSSVAAGVALSVGVEASAVSTDAKVALGAGVASAELSDWVLSEVVEGEEANEVKVSPVSPTLDSAMSPLDVLVIVLTSVISPVAGSMVTAIQVLPS